MALVNCQDCGREMSESAAVCLQCGRPMQRRQPEKKGTNPWMVIGWILLVILLLPLATCALLVGGGVGGEAYSDYRERASAGQPTEKPSLEVLVRGYEGAARAGSSASMRDYATAISKHYPGTMLPPVEVAPAKDEFTED